MDRNPYGAVARPGNEQRLTSKRRQQAPNTEDPPAPGDRPKGAPKGGGKGGGRSAKGQAANECRGDVRAPGCIRQA